MPYMVVVAGPAGSGKTTTFPPSVFGVAHFSVDDRAAALNAGSYVGITAAQRTQAGAACRAFIADRIASRGSFAVETTLRTDAAIVQAQEAKAAGFVTFMLFVGTEDVALNVGRIKARGKKRGHSSPEAEIRAIFAASMGNLPRALAVFDRVECFDNSQNGDMARPVLTIEQGRVVSRAARLPGWVTPIVRGA
jgi:predicted ABC-type ATPase